MATRNQISQEKHDQLIKNLVSSYLKEGCSNLKADLEGYEQPEQIGSYIPDVTMRKNGIVYIGEAETDDSIDQDHTKEQWRAFSKALGRFEVVVPESILERAKENAKTWDVQVDHWWFSR